MTISDFKNADDLYALLDRNPQESEFILVGTAITKFHISMRRILNRQERQQRRRITAIIGRRSGECANVTWSYKYAE